MPFFLVNMMNSFILFRKTLNNEIYVDKTTVPFEELERWYDGYYLSDGSSLFNPRSVHKALTRGILPQEMII